jgi:hypothetical protein
MPIQLISRGFKSLQIASAIRLLIRNGIDFGRSGKEPTTLLFALTLILKITNRFGNQRKVIEHLATRFARPIYQ